MENAKLDDTVADVSWMRIEHFFDIKLFIAVLAFQKNTIKIISYCFFSQFQEKFQLEKKFC